MANKEPFDFIPLLLWFAIVGAAAAIGYFGPIQAFIGLGIIAGLIGILYVSLRSVRGKELSLDELKIKGYQPRKKP